MRRVKQSLFVSFALLLSTIGQAQLEAAYLHTKGFNAIGFGGHLNFKFPIGDAAYLTTEAGFYIFQKNESNVAVAPILLGYQRTFDGTGTGFFIEPLAGYSFGGTDLYMYSENGSPLSDPNNPGEWWEYKAEGPTAGIAFGYITRGDKPLTIGLRYERVFVSSTPALNLASLRFTWPLFGGRN